MRRSLLIIALLFGVLLAAAAAYRYGGMHGACELCTEPAGFAGGPVQVEVVSTQVGGKNVFIPGSIVLTQGAGRSLTVFNTTDGPHGFQIPDLGIEEVLQPGVEHVIELPKLRGGRVHEVRCHLHPPHRRASLLVLP